MWELISRLPAPILLSVFAWGAVCLIWLQPLVETRKAQTTYVPMCRAGHLPKISNADTGQDLSNTETDKQEQSTQTPFGAQFTSELRSIFRDENEHDYRQHQYAGTDTCTCAVDFAYQQNMWPSLVSVMLFDKYQPRSIAQFEVSVAIAKSSGVCS